MRTAESNDQSIYRCALASGSSLVATLDLITIFERALCVSRDGTATAIKRHGDK